MPNPTPDPIDRAAVLAAIEAEREKWPARDVVVRTSMNILRDRIAALPACPVDSTHHNTLEQFAHNLAAAQVDTPVPIEDVFALADSDSSQPVVDNSPAHLNRVSPEESAARAFEAMRKRDDFAAPAVGVAGFDDRVSKFVFPGWTALPEGTLRTATELICDLWMALTALAAQLTQERERAAVAQKRQDFLAEQLRQRLDACREQLLVLANENDSLQSERDALAARLAEVERERDDFHIEYRMRCDEKTKAANTRAEAAEQALALEADVRQDAERRVDDLRTDLGQVMGLISGWRPAPGEDVSEFIRMLIPYVDALADAQKKLAKFGQVEWISPNGIPVPPRDRQGGVG